MTTRARIGARQKGTTKVTVSGRSSLDPKPRQFDPPVPVRKAKIAKQEDPYVSRPSGPTPVYLTREKGDGPYSLPDEVPSDLSQLPSLSLRPLPASPTQSSTIEISPSPGCLSVAISSAPEGSVLSIPAGKYRESLQINKSLTFIAKGPVSLRGDGSAETVSVTDGVVTFNGFSIKQKISPTRAAIIVLKGTLFLDNCLVRSGAGASIQLRDEGQAKIVNSVVKAATTPAVSLSQNAEVICERSVFEHSKTVAFQLKGSAKGSITRCRFQHSPKGGLSVTDSAAVLINSSRFTNCNIELANDSGVNVITGSLIEWSDPGHSESPGVIVAQRTVAHVIGNRITNYTVDSRETSSLTLARNEFVDGTLLIWGNAQSSSTGDHFTGNVAEVRHVAISVTGQTTFRLSDVVIEKLTGSGVVVYGSGEGGESEGWPKVTVERGTIGTVSGSGLIAHTGADLGVRELVVSGCGENGILVSGTKSVIVEDITATGCDQAGIQIIATDQATLKKLTGKDNPGCGLVVARSKAEVTDSTFTGNQRGGIHVTDANVNVTNTEFIGNKQGGLVVAGGGIVTAETIRLSENDRGGLVVADGGTGTIVNGKFESNEIGLSIAGKAVITKSSVEANRKFGAQVFGNATFSDLTFERNPVGLTVVAPGLAQVNAQTKFTANVTHLEVSNGGKVIGTNAVFTESTGTCGVHVIGATATFTTCEFLQDSKVAIFSEGDLSIDDSRVEGAGEAGFVFGGGSTGTVSNSTIKKNGKVAAQVQGGTPTLKENTVSEHDEFGIYVIRGAQPIVEHNNFKSNGLANVWRGDAPR